MVGMISVMALVSISTYHAHQQSPRSSWAVGVDAFTPSSCLPSHRQSSRRTTWGTNWKENEGIFLLSDRKQCDKTSLQFHLSPPSASEWSLRVPQRNQCIKRIPTNEVPKLNLSSSPDDDVGEVSLPPSTEKSDSTAAEAALPKIDRILSQLTSLFPFFVLGSAILGSLVPNTLNWVNRGNYITYMLAG